ncbi:phosphotransferase [Vallitalea okinawensis]|uniref:phosphotransferase n=1 Tax=Vallitalea okinawensis TaxID=2078660 RepID=UPI000CFCE703|nr:phosphotransferase [Vallitalea okinawensis]
MEDSIIADLKDRFGLTCNHINPVTGGWLNKKWKVSTEKCDLLVKQFSNKRFSRDKLKLVESALQRQIILKKNGIPCPAIWQYGGHAIRLLDNETAYMVMDFDSGKVESPNTITIMQMHSLGSACGMMHKAFSLLPMLSVKGFPINNKQVIDTLWANFHVCMKDCSSSTPNEYQKAVLTQEPILKQLTNDFFDRLPKGIAHEDFTSDNILFNVDCVSAIIDFDRNHYSYIWHDIGRAILSFALEDNRMNIEKISAFLDGYSQHLMLTLPNIADALRLTWCIEVPWWIQPEYFRENRGKAVRFRDEILWLTELWFEIDSLLCC